VISTYSESGTIETQDELSTISFAFIPASWISKTVIQLRVEVCRMQDQTRTLSIHLKPPGKLCSDKAVLASLGLGLYDENRGPFYRRLLGNMDPTSFRDFLSQGRVGANDIVQSKKLGAVSVLEVCQDAAQPS
jgi:hypothetical protein